MSKLNKNIHMLCMCGNYNVTKIKKNLYWERRQIHLGKVSSWRAEVLCGKGTNRIQSADGGRPEARLVSREAIPFRQRWHLVLSEHEEGSTNLSRLVRRKLSRKKGVESNDKPYK